MKLFNKFEAVKFPEENMIFITNNSYLYYIYNPKYNRWYRYSNAGNDMITVCNYLDVSEEELRCAMGGKVAQKETDIMRLLSPTLLNIGQMLNLLCEDYPEYMDNMINNEIYNAVYSILIETKIKYEMYIKIRELFDNAIKMNQCSKELFDKIRSVSIEIDGKDIFKEEIGIVDGHDNSSYFWIMPVRVIKSDNTNELDSVAEMRSIEISIEELDIYHYLTPFLYKYFDDELEANRRRIEFHYTDDEGNECINYVKGFEWYLTNNFYTFESVSKMIDDIKDTIDALSSNNENEYTNKLKKNGGIEIHSENIIIDFYNRFIYRMEYMMKVGAENGYNLISFMGP